MDKYVPRPFARFLHAVIAVGLLISVSDAIAQVPDKRGSREPTPLGQLEQEIREQKSINTSRREALQLQQQIGTALRDIQSIRDAISHVDDVVKRKACLRIPQMAKNLGETVANSRATLRSVTDQCAKIDRTRAQDEDNVCRAQETLLNQRLSTLTNEYDSLLAACEIATQ